MSGGHGHVVPRADRRLVDCGGPTICPDCRREAQLLAEIGAPDPGKQVGYIALCGRVCVSTDYDLAEQVLARHEEGCPHCEAQRPGVNAERRSLREALLGTGR